MDRLSDYDYELPDSAIAQEPLADRSASRLLWLHKDGGSIEHRRFVEVVDILQKGDLLVMNDTRVTAFRLFGKKETGASVELLALKQLDAQTYECLLKPGRRLQPGTKILFKDNLSAEVLTNLEDGRKQVRFHTSGDLNGALKNASSTPLPPYIHTQLHDPERYQTVYARMPGSAAAPTAGLHFTKAVLDTLRGKGVQMAWVTLDVGIDTFRPVQCEDPSQHAIHGEVCEMPTEAVNAINKCEGRIIAVGTTSVRTLETFAVGSRQVEPGRKDTKLFIRPGYKFKVIDGMFTNFHMPRTTMLMMISALAGRQAVMHAYDDALKAGYRFLSFGDSMLIV